MLLFIDEDSRIHWLPKRLIDLASVKIIKTCRCHQEVNGIAQEDQGDIIHQKLDQHLQFQP